MLKSSIAATAIVFSQRNSRPTRTLSRIGAIAITPMTQTLPI